MDKETKQLSFQDPETKVRIEYEMLKCVGNVTIPRKKNPQHLGGFKSLSLETHPFPMTS